VKIAYLDCFSGISGDMFLAALVDAGVPFSILQDAVASLNLEAHLEIHRVNRSGIDAAKIDVLTATGELVEQAHAVPTAAHHHEHDHSHEYHHDHGHNHSHTHAHGRSLPEIQQIIANSGLPASVQAAALKAFFLLGHAEAKIHNVPVEDIHFHEVGAVDAIADIVATAAGCHWLQVDRWFCSPLNVGSGHVHCAHGKFPVPAPATLELLRDLPIYSSGVQAELITPTGAALLRALDVTSSTFPAMRLNAAGYGAGSRDLAGAPNVLRLVIGESAQEHHSGTSTKIGIIETTIDDATPELISYIADRLLAAGASDVYRTAVQMKKGRTGTLLTILCTPARAEELQRLVFAESTTLGLRYREESKIVLARTHVPVVTPWGKIGIKVGSLEDGDIVNYAPEYEDCRRIAEQYSIPLKHVMQTAMNAYQKQEEREQEEQA
jgi:pyridinium-3,5-bisthiocarboxylic acid mononucleotide nickel chelatase